MTGCNGKSEEKRRVARETEELGEGAWERRETQRRDSLEGGKECGERGEESTGTGHWTSGCPTLHPGCP